MTERRGILENCQRKRYPGGFGRDSRRDADPFDDARKIDKRRHVRVRELVRQFVRGFYPGGKQGPNQESNMALLVEENRLQIGVERILEPRGYDIGVGELGEGSFVEGALQEFESQGEIEDDAVVDDGRGDARGQ